MIIYSSKIGKACAMLTVICVCTCVIVRKSKGSNYLSLFGIIYKQEGNDERAFYHDRQLE